MRRWVSRLRAAVAVPQRRWLSDKAGGLGSEKIFSVDTSGLYKARKPRKLPVSRDGGAQTLTEELSVEIAVRGPLSVATFMNHCLTNPRYGYYTSKENVIGAAGDFVTSPEISQVFGELVGVWCVAAWMQMGEPEALNLVEFGPGRGTLMQDVVRATAKFPAFASAIHVHLLEISPVMREQQREALGVGPLAFVEETGVYVGKNAETGLDVTWHVAEASIPYGNFVCVAHEFFDALPVHQFEFTKEHDWCERLIDVAEEGDPGDSPFRFVLSPGATAATNAFLTKGKVKGEPGDRIEVSPETLAIGESLAKRMKRPNEQGAFLAIDYGADQPHAESLQAVKQHRFVPSIIDEEPGTFDLTAHVDFASLRRVMTQTNPQLTCPPLVTQAQWLQNMGIGPRIKMLIDQNPAAEEELMSQAQRLLDDSEEGGMGSLFKVFAATHTKGATGTDVAGFVELS